MSAQVKGHKLQLIINFATCISLDAPTYVTGAKWEKQAAVG